jgi:hypothetical protein
VPILGGARLLGRQSGFQIGALQMRTEDAPLASATVTDFSVLRINRDVLSRSRVGAIVTRRAPGATVGVADNYAYGADAMFNLQTDLSMSGYWAATETPGRTGKNSSYRGAFNWNADRTGLQVEHLFVGDDFNPEVGLMRREDFQRSLVEGRFGRRPTGSNWLKKWSVVGALDYTTDTDRVLESRSQLGSARLDLMNGDEASMSVERSYEALTEPLELSEDHLVPAGRYHFTIGRAAYTLGPRHRFATGDVGVGGGSFYGGSLFEASYRGRLDLVGRLTLEPNIAVNWIDVPSEPDAFWLNVFGLRATLPFSPRASVSTLVQYGTGDGHLGTSVRLRWEYRPGSDLFVVFSDGHDTTRPGNPMVNRSFAV